jgi:iron(III) transport system ATP-binding protein
MRSEIRRIQQELGITSVYVTHDQDEAMVLSDQIVVMNQGKVQQVGTAVGIYRRPTNRFVADFIGRANFLPAEVLGAAGPGRWQVRVLDQALNVPGTESVRVGTPALLMVRPESLRVSATPLSGAGVLAATVARTAYLGSLAEYELALGGQRVVAVRHDPGEGDLYAVGLPVWVQVLAENAYLLGEG